jgi:hypothetical protein
MATAGGPSSGHVDVSERIDGEVLGGITVQVVGHAKLFLPLIVRSWWTELAARGKCIEPLNRDIAVKDGMKVPATDLTPDLPGDSVVARCVQILALRERFCIHER